jgi:hypothetical protein
MPVAPCTARTHGGVAGVGGALIQQAVTFLQDSKRLRNMGANPSSVRTRYARMCKAVPLFDLLACPPSIPQDKQAGDLTTTGERTTHRGKCLRIYTSGLMGFRDWPGGVSHCAKCLVFAGRVRRKTSKCKRPKMARCA